MNEAALHDVNLIGEDLRAAGLGVDLLPFGSAVGSGAEAAKDFDVAVVVDDARKPDVVARMRRAAGWGARSLNWVIDVFDPREATWGYNGRHMGTLHFFVLTRSELEGDSTIARNIRDAG